MHTYSAVRVSDNPPNGRSDVGEHLGVVGRLLIIPEGVGKKYDCKDVYVCACMHTNDACTV